MLSIYSLPAIVTPLLLTPYTTEGITGCTSEAANGSNNAGRNPPSCFFISSFTVSVTPLINTFEYSNDYMILIISFISSFEISKVNPFPALTAKMLTN